MTCLSVQNKKVPKEMHLPFCIDCIILFIYLQISIFYRQSSLSLLLNIFWLMQNAVISARGQEKTDFHP